LTSPDRSRRATRPAKSPRGQFMDADCVAQGPKASRRGYQDGQATRASFAGVSHGESEKDETKGEDSAL
jgi:hypothetical protein